MSIVKDIIDITKELRNMAKEVSNQPMIDLAVDIQDKIFDLKNNLEDLKEENRDLRRKLEESNNIKEIESDLIPHNQAFYTRKSDKIERLYCARCWDKEKVLIQLQGHPKWSQYGARDLKCPECKYYFEIFKSSLNDEE